MTIYKCDICGHEYDEKDRWSLSTLSDEFQTHDVKHACKECMDELNHAYSNMLLAMNQARTTFLQRFILRLMGRKAGQK